MAEHQASEHAESTGAILAALLANLGIAVVKFAGFLITGSSSLLAESIHSVADSSNQGLLVLGGKRSRRPPTPLHPFGYGRVRYFWSFVVAVVLFSLGGLFSLYEGYHKVADPNEVNSPIVAFVILGLAIVFEGFALRTAMRHAEPHRRGRSWRTYIRTSRSPELPVLLLEDSGALLGLVLAVLGVALSLITGEPLFDGLGTMAIGVLLVVIAVVLAIEMKSLLIGEAATPEVIRATEEAIGRGPGVRRLVEVLTQHLGPEDILVAARVEFDQALTAREVAEAINACEAEIRAVVPADRVLIYLEPVLARGGADADGASGSALAGGAKVATRHAGASGEGPVAG